MTGMPDKLEAIKARLEAGRHRHKPGPGLNMHPIPSQQQIARLTLFAHFEDDMDWLIAEVERLRALEEIIDLSNVDIGVDQTVTVEGIV